MHLFWFFLFVCYLNFELELLYIWQLQRLPEVEKCGEKRLFNGSKLTEADQLEKAEIQLPE